MKNSVRNAEILQCENVKTVAATAIDTTTIAATTQITPPLFSKRIGSTTYTVSVYHSQTSKETAEDKLLRLIENEVRRGA